MKLKVLELFGGIGACSKALEKLGIDYEIADYVEIDKYAVKSFNAIHNTNFEPQDITTWNKDIEVDLIMHGSPCQDFSLAGKQAGGDKDSGTRSSLMYETIRIVEKLKPKYVIWENVKNLLSKKHRHNFDAYLETMHKLGYTSCYQVLNAKDYGIPQNRERVFTVSIRYDVIYNSDKLFNFNFPPKQELKLKLKDILEDEVDEKYYLSDIQIKRIETTTYNVGKTRIQKKEWCDTLCARDWKDPKCVEITSGAYARNFGSKGKLQDKKYCDTLTASMGTGGGNVPMIANKTICLNSKGGRNGVEGLQPSLKDRIYDSNGIATCCATSNFFMPNYTDNLRIRKLIPKECWRLMGFDDEDFEKASKVNSNTQLYKQAGNSIVVNVLEAILKNLLF